MKDRLIGAILSPFLSFGLLIPGYQVAPPQIPYEPLPSTITDSSGNILYKVEELEYTSKMLSCTSNPPGEFQEASTQGNVYRGVSGKITWPCVKAAISGTGVGSGIYQTIASAEYARQQRGPVRKDYVPPNN